MCRRGNQTGPSDPVNNGPARPLQHQSTAVSIISPVYEPVYNDVNEPYYKNDDDTYDHPNFRPFAEFSPYERLDRTTMQ